MASSFWQTVIRFDASKIAPEIAVRNTIGIVTPLIVGTALGNTAAGAVAALGALNVCYSDGRDAYATRARRMLLASVLVSVAATAGALTARNDWASMAAATIWAFGAGMMVVLGPKAADVGSVTLVSLLVFGGRRLSIEEAFNSGLLAFAGGLLQLLLSIVTWPIKPYGPEQRLIGNLYRELARAAVSRAGPGTRPPASAAVVSAAESLALLDPSASGEAARLIFLMNQAERIRLSLLTLRRLARRLEREPETQPAAKALEHVLRAASTALKEIAECAESGRIPGTRTEPHAALEEFRSLNRDGATPVAAAFLRDAARQVEMLAGQMRAVARAGVPVSAIRLTDPSTIKDRFLANLSFRSVAFRHAVRLALCVALGVTLGRKLNLERPYWLPMTVAIVLKPDFVSTFSRGILRVAGTLAGLVVATAAVLVLKGTPADIALLGVFALLLRWVGPANYGIFVVAVSGIVVILIALIGVVPKDVIVARAVNTVLGGAVALAAYALWPTWERTQTGAVLGEMLDVYDNYFQLVMSAPSNSAAQAELERARNAGRVARSSAEASAARFFAEPGTPRARRTLLSEILMNTHSFVRAVMALESDYDGSGGTAVNVAVREFTSTASEALHRAAKGIRTGCKPAGRPPDVRAAWTALEQVAQPHSLLTVETDRITTSLDILWEQAAKWDTRR
jgi:uncharacterized membrane protein YccC